MKSGSTGGRADVAHREEGSVYGVLREVLLTGVAIIVPLVVTLYVLGLLLGFVFDVVSPLADVLKSTGIGANTQEVLVDVLALGLLLGIVVLVGSVTYFRSGRRAINYFDVAMERVPGVGAVYKSFRQMSDVMLESDEHNFRDVKLVEFPHDATYTLGFETTETPTAIRDAAGETEMETLFLPLAPNPVMGGFLGHVPADRVRDVDMTVEEGLRTVVTMGVATAELGSGHDGLSPNQMARISEMGYAEEPNGPASSEESADEPGESASER